jgi:hypothetical protein
MLRKLLMAQASVSAFRGDGGFLFAQSEVSHIGKKKQQAQMILRAGLRKADSLPEFLYMIHLSSKTMTLTTSLAPIWNLRSLQI